MRHYTDNFYRSLSHGRNPQLLSDGILIAERMTCQVLIDHDHGRVIKAIAFIEEPATQEWNTHRLQIIRGYGRGECDGRLVRRRRDWGSPVTHHIFSYSHGNDIGEGDIADSGNVPKIVCEFTPGGSGLGRIAQYTRRERHPRG